MVRKIFELFLSLLKVYLWTIKSLLIYLYCLRQRFSKKKLSCRYYPMSVSCATVNTGRLTLKTSLPWMKVHLHVSRVNQRKCVPWTTKLIWSSSIKKKISFFKIYTGMNDPPYQMFTPKGEQITLILIKYNHLKFHHQILTRSLNG